MGDPAEFGGANRDRIHFRAVRPGLTAFAFAVILGCGVLGLSACQRSGRSPVGHRALPAPQVGLGQSIALSPWVRLTQPAGFEQRYVPWLAGFEALNRLMTGVNQLPGLQAGVKLEVRSCDRPQLHLVQQGQMQQGQTLQLCYELLSYLEDHFDGQSASPRERQIAVLDSVYLLVVRQLSQMILAGYGLTATPEALDELTALLPRVLRQRSPDILLSGTQWIFNQGQPLPFVARLAQVSGQPLSLENYDRLICNAYGIAPVLYPYLKTESPNPSRLDDCEQWAIATDPVEQWSARLQSGSFPALPSGIMPPIP